MKPTLTEQDFIDAAALLQCDVPAIKAVFEVEAPRGGFNPDGTPTTLFEGHQFYKHTGGKFSAVAPTLCHKEWTTKNYGKGWQAEQARLQAAMALDREAALKSASWGKAQIMGFNYESAGFNTVQEFVNAMYSGERAHLMAFVNFVKNNSLAPALRRHDWPTFARGYNGGGYKVNKYDTKLASAHTKHRALA